MFAHFSHCPSGEAQPGEVPRPRKHGRCIDKDEQSRRSDKSLPETIDTFQTNSGKSV